MSILEVENLSTCYSNRQVLNNISFNLNEGEWLMIAGPNGAGKSTLAKALTKGIAYTGKVSLCGTDIQRLSSKNIAKKIGLLSQKHSPGYAFSVYELVELGRYSHSTNGSVTLNDNIAVQNAIKITGLEQLAERSVLTLSGGELQRAFLAQLFAQNPQIMILDEPANNLDINFQKLMLDLVGRWLDENKTRAVIMIVHDLSIALKYGTHALILKDGETVSYGNIKKALASENLNFTFEMNVPQYMHDLLNEWNNI